MTFLTNYLGASLGAEMEAYLGLYSADLLLLPQGEKPDSTYSSKASYQYSYPSSLFDSRKKACG